MTTLGPHTIIDLKAEDGTEMQTIYDHDNDAVWIEIWMDQTPGILLCAMDDGALIQYEDTLFVSAAWIENEHPGDKEHIQRIKRLTRQAKAGHPN